MSSRSSADPNGSTASRRPAPPPAAEDVLAPAPQPSDDTPTIITKHAPPAAPSEPNAVVEGPFTTGSSRLGTTDSGPA